MIPIILLIFTLESCHGSTDFNSRARNFSIELINSTGLEHVVVAPFIVWSVMAGAALWTYGESQEQIMNVLILPNNKNNFLNDYMKLRKSLTSVNRVTYEGGIFILNDNNFYIFPEFKETMAKYFEAEFISVNFNDTKEATRLVHDYIERKIPSIINVFHENDFVNATMIMSNAMSFIAFWKNRFSVLDTTDENFNRPDGVYTVRMMHKKMKVPYSNIESMKANVMELGFGDDGVYNMLFIFPYPNVNIREVYNTLNNVTLKDIFDRLESDVNEFGLKEIDVKLPRIRMQIQLVLNKALSDIGLINLFESGQGNFIGISREDIYISSIEHVVDFSMSESGIYVKASTPGHFSFDLITPKLEAEQPFIFFVTHKPTQMIIVGGLYSKSSYS